MSYQIFFVSLDVESLAARLAHTVHVYVYTHTGTEKRHGTTRHGVPWLAFSPTMANRVAIFLASFSPAAAI